VHRECFLQVLEENTLYVEREIRLKKFNILTSETDIRSF
jgi:hypothetical protein